MKLPLLALAAILVIAGAALPARAQNDVAAPVADRAAMQFQWRALPVRSVAPRLIAWQLDPVNNPQPPEFRAPGDNAPGQADFASKSLFADDDGVRSIVAADAQKTLLVLSTPAGFARVQEMVDVLDQPIRFVEIEAEFIAIAPEETGILGFENPDTRLIQVGFPRANFRKRLSELTAQNKAKMLASPYLVTANNLGQRAIVAQSAPLYTIKGDEKTAAPTLTVREANVLDITPTINGDSTLTLLISPARTLLLTSSQTDEPDDGAVFRKLSGPQSEAVSPFPLALQNGEGWTNITNVRDGATVALSGFKANWLVADEQTAEATTTLPQRIVLLVTARIVPPAKN